MENLEPNLLTILAALVNFAILVGFLSFFFFKPVSKMLAERRKGIEEDMEAAKRAREEAEALKAEYEAKMVQLKRDIHDAIEKATWQGEKVKEEIIGSARNEARSIIEKARIQAEKEARRVWDEQRDAIIDLALASASKILMREIGDQDQRLFVKRLLDEVANSEKGEPA